jgi:hypothetical protein
MEMILNESESLELFIKTSISKKIAESSDKLYQFVTNHANLDSNLKSRFSELAARVCPISIAVTVSEMSFSCKIPGIFDTACL